MNTIRLYHLDCDQDYRAAFNVMRELRPNLTDAVAFAEQVRRQAEQGYRVLSVLQGDEVTALAGYRVQENLLYGRFLYVDDLVTAAGARQHGLGAMLIDALRDEARKQGCANLVLDTGLGNSLAQRFYFRQGLLAFGMHFRQQL